MGKQKIVYKDGKSTKVLFGFIQSEDSIFFKVLAEDNTEFRLNKNSVISVKGVRNDL